MLINASIWQKWYVCLHLLVLNMFGSCLTDFVLFYLSMRVTQYLKCLTTGVGPRNVGQISGEDYGASNLSKNLVTVITQSFGANSVWTVGICILEFVLIFFHYIEFGLKKPSGPQNVGLDFLVYLTIRK